MSNDWCQSVRDCSLFDDARFPEEDFGREMKPFGQIWLFEYTYFSSKVDRSMPVFGAVE